MRHLIRVIFATVLLLSGTVFLSAQTNSGPDYDAWRVIATRAEASVEAGRASDIALEELRAQLVEWRETLGSAQATNATAIRIIENQLAALGPVPEGEIELADISRQRQALTDRLAELQVPVKTAEIAYTEADGLIRGIDGIIRNRQTEELLELGPTPINPIIWPTGLEALQNSLASVGFEVGTAWSNPIQNAEFRKNLPEVLLLLTVAMLLLLRGRRWFEYLATVIQRRSATLWRWLAASAVSLGQIIVPYIGLVALIEAALATELAGLRGERILLVLPDAGFAILVSVWLASRVFPKLDQVEPFIKLPFEERREARVYAGLLGLILAIDLILTELARYDTWSDEAQAVVYFPLFAVTALVFWRLAVLLSHHNRNSSEVGYGDRLVTIWGRLIMAVALIGLSLAAIGYFSAAQRLFFPAISTMQILAAILVLQRIFSAIYAVAIGGEENANDSLVPVFLGILLVIASLPILALIWGARASDLTELWAQFSKGVSIGDTRISPTDFFMFVLVFVAGLTVTRLLQGTMKNTILPKTKIDIGGQNALVSGLGYVGIFLAALIAITTAGIDLSSIALVAGALSVGIGFGLQNVVSNFVSGIILLIERPISEGDWIEVGGNMGYVRGISVRSTRIETFDRTDVIVPNSDLVSGTVTNFTRGNTIGRVIAPVGVAYGTDPRRIEAILLEIAKAHPMVLDNPAPSIVFQGFGASSLDFEIRAIIRDVNWSLTVRSELNYEIAKRFMDEGIEIPFAQTDIWLRNAEALRAPHTSEESSE